MSQAEAMKASKPKRGGLVGVILKWGEFVKFSHTIFAMPFALGAMMVASREHYRYLEKAKADLLKANEIMEAAQKADETVKKNPLVNQALRDLK